MSEPTKPADELERLAKLAEKEAKGAQLMASSRDWTTGEIEWLTLNEGHTRDTTEETRRAYEREAADWRTIADIIRRAPVAGSGRGTE